MDNREAEIETLKARSLVLEQLLRDQLRETDARERHILDLKNQLTLAKGQLMRMQTDRNSEE
jgi:hypothetical protein